MTDRNQTDPNYTVKLLNNAYSGNVEFVCYSKAKHIQLICVLGVENEFSK